MAAQTMLDFTKEEIEWFRNESKLKYELDLRETIFDAQEEARAEGREKGLAEGRTEGLAEGRTEEKLQIARNLKQMGLSDALIASATGLSPEDIQRAQETQNPG
ncbi:MAG: hypothetical protein LBQ88_08495 [Treponema sp.]|jgi:predicted transposase/invertase (TIGR01784 family)|nr:hypothetical protein [Treponema sp.]